MTDQELLHGCIEIPKHWDFPQRNVSGLEVIQIDTRQSFLAYRLPDDPTSVTRPNYKGEYGDIFFDQEGSRLDRRLHKSFDTDIELAREIHVSCWVHERDKLIQPRNSDVTLVFSGYRTDPPLSLLGLADYKNTHLASVGLGNRFLDIENKENYSIGPWLTFEDYSQESFLSSANWELDFPGELPDSKFFVLHDDAGTQAGIFNHDGKQIFRLEWGIEGSFFSVSQSHVLTGIVKTLRAPLEINADRVSEAIFSKPRYSKDEKGRLIVPWTNIDQIVGARLSYSYPPQSPKQNPEK